MQQTNLIIKIRTSKFIQIQMCSGQLRDEIILWKILAHMKGICKHTQFYIYIKIFATYFIKRTKTTMTDGMYQNRKSQFLVMKLGYNCWVSFIQHAEWVQLQTNNVVSVPTSGQVVDCSGFFTRDMGVYWYRVINDLINLEYEWVIS